MEYHGKKIFIDFLIRKNKNYIFFLYIFSLLYNYLNKWKNPISLDHLIEIYI